MTAHETTPVRVAVIGAGHVGAAFAFALLRSGLASEIVLVDADHARAEGEAMDLDHAVPFGRPARVWAGGYADCVGAAIVVITAGAGQRPGQTRLDLAKHNATVLREIVPQVARHAPNAVLIVATNPVDVLTMAALQLSGFPPARVMGSGTILDTARLRFLLSRRLGVDSRSIHTHVIGEHGDSEVVVWSTATVAGIPLDERDHASVTRQTREAAAAVVQRKGHTAFAIGAGLVRIVEAILRDEKSVLSVSSTVDGAYGIHDVCLSLPSVVGRDGVERVLVPDLDDVERDALVRSADTIRASARSVGFAQ